MSLLETTVGDVHRYLNLFGRLGIEVDFSVHHSGDTGVPRVSGCTSSSSASNHRGCTSTAGFTPAPGRRCRSDGSTPARTSRVAVFTVEVLIPVASTTRA